MNTFIEVAGLVSLLVVVVAVLGELEFLFSFKEVKLVWEVLFVGVGRGGGVGSLG